MRGPTAAGPWWAALTVWAVVNAVNLLQAAGFVSRVATGGRAVNHALGYGILLLAVPAAVALVGVWGSGASWLARLGPAVFLAFVGLAGWVDYLAPVAFRDPARPELLVPYLALFYGAILLMGAPMVRVHRGLWWCTVATSALHLAAMAWALARGVG